MVDTIVYSTDAEHYYNAEEILENIENEFKLGETITVNMGFPVLATHAEFVNPMSIIENICDQSSDDFGEFSEDYLRELQSDESVDGLKDVIAKWLQDTVGAPTFYRVIDATEHSIVVTEDIVLPKPLCKRDTCGEFDTGKCVGTDGNCILYLDEADKPQTTGDSIDDFLFIEQHDFK